MFKIRQYGDDWKKDGVHIQNFSNKKKELAYDEFRNVLKEVGEIDLFEQIQSVEFSSVDKLLNRFLETGEVSILNGIRKHNAFADRCEVLNKMSETIEDLENYKREQGINEDIGLDKIAESLMNSKSELDKYIKSRLEDFYKQKNALKDNVKKEVQKDEKNEDE